MDTTEKLRKALEQLYLDQQAAQNQDDLYRQAAIQSQLAYLPKAQAIEDNAAQEQALIDKQLQELDKQTAANRSQLTALYDQERQNLSDQALARGLAHSSIALNMQQEAGQRHTDAQAQLLAQAADQQASLQQQARDLAAEMQQALMLNDYEMALDTRSRYDTLLANMQKQQLEQAKLEAQKQSEQQQLAQRQEEFAAEMQYQAKKLAQEQAQFEAQMAQEAKKQEESQAAQNAKNDAQGQRDAARQLYQYISKNVETASDKTVSDWYRLLQQEGYYRNLLGDSQTKKLLDLVTKEMERRSRLEAASDMMGRQSS